MIKGGFLLVLAFVAVKKVKNKNVCYFSAGKIAACVFSYLFLSLVCIIFAQFLEKYKMNQLPVVTKNLIAINVLMFLATIVAERYGIDLNGYMGLHLFLAGDFHPYQLVTYMFMHGGFTHLFFNMFALYMFGGLLERVWGAKLFLIYYFFTGIGAAFIQEATQYAYYVMYLSQYEYVRLAADALVPMSQYLNMWNTVGASGAVYGILLAFAMMFPNERMYVIPIPFPIKAKYFVMIFCVLELLLGWSNNAGDNVAHFAHLGGVLFGLLLILYWRKKGKISGPYV